MALLPPLRLVGATILRDGALRQRSVAVEGGRITKGPLPAVDLSGYLILPGIIDLHGEGFERQLMPRDGPGYDLHTALAATDREAAANGITTAWLAQGWSWEGGHRGPDQAEALMATLASYRPQALTDLRVQLRAETHLVDEGARLLAAVRRWGVGYVVFNNHLDAALDLLRFDPDAFAGRAHRLGRKVIDHHAALLRASANAREVPRHLCTLAEAFDRHGVLYGSHHDSAGDMREHFSMIGARIAQCPTAIEAAAAARAMGDPVLMGAPNIMRGGATGGHVAAADLVAAGLCDALVSDCHYPSLPAAAFRLVDLGLRTLPEAWAMISSRPAEIMRLADRGTLDHGRRADLVVIEAESRRIECTIAGGRISHLSGGAAERFIAALGTGAGQSAAA